jgi:hypothetical protein
MKSGGVTLPDSNSVQRASFFPQIIFANWRESLHRTGLRKDITRAYADAIEAYLDYCAKNSQSVTVETARGFMTDAVRRGLTPYKDTWQQALNWFFREGRKRTATQPPGVPTPGAADTGKTPWESRLIERLRINHYSWRTEQTYREWAWRFLAFLGPRQITEATDLDLKQFLSELAVKGRVSVATQKQALNALVFLFREALGKDGGDLSDFIRARRGRRPPAVRAPAEFPP